MEPVAVPAAVPVISVVVVRACSLELDAFLGIADCSSAFAAAMECRRACASPAGLLSPDRTEMPAARRMEKMARRCASCNRRVHVGI